jgi:hypothetical protein
MTTPQKNSRRQESGLAKRYGGTVTPGSGNGWVKKNDVRTDTVSFEAKYTEKKQFTLKQADLHTAEKHALLDGRDAVFIISFAGEEWAVLREEDYREYHQWRANQHSPVAAAAPKHALYDQPMLPGADAWL